MPLLAPTPSSTPETHLLAGFQRYEFKFIVSPAQVDSIRPFLLAFCEADPHATGQRPEYTVRTLHLDTPYHDLFLAKERRSNNRFKLRMRAYGEECSGRLTLEIKQKVGEVYYKQKAPLLSDRFEASQLFDAHAPIALEDPQEIYSYLNFVRLVRELAARPAALIRYHRECYNSVADPYARVTLDRDLCYLPTRQWNLYPEPRIWRRMDIATAFRDQDSGYILELKFAGPMPSWMSELIERFDLRRQGFCKYAAAMRLESLFCGFRYSDESENCTY